MPTTRVMTMTTLGTHPTAPAQWFELVSDTETAAAPPMGEGLENYLVLFAIRFTFRTRISHPWIQSGAGSVPAP